MEFLAIIIVWGLLQYWGSGSPLQNDQWFSRWVEQLKILLPAPHLRLLVLVALPLIALCLLQWLISHWLFGLLSLLLAVAILLYSLGRGDLSEALATYLADWDSADFEGAYQRATAIGHFSQSDAISDSRSLHLHVRRALLYAAYERWFAVIFWFVLLGPIGALGYRLSYLCTTNEKLDEEDRHLALRAVHYLDWLPARLLALSFALTGNFVNCFNRWGTIVADNLPADELLDHCGCSALTEASEQRVFPDDDQRAIEFGREELQATQALMSRSMVCWLIVIALLQLVSL